MGREPSKWAHAHSSLEPGQFTSLALTHVQYHPDDPLSMPLALVTLAPPFLIASYVSILLVRRELTILFAFIGQLGCEGVNLALKRTFKQGRPTDFLGTGYGMPSSHSQFAGYFAAFWLCHLLTFRPGMSRRRQKRQQGAWPWSRIDTLRLAEHYTLLALILTGCVAVPYSRYHLAYHSIPQIAVGFSAGAACGLVWYYIVEVLGRKRIPRTNHSLRDILLQHPLLAALRIRDSWAVWDDAGIEAEYALWRSTQRQMRHRGATLARTANDNDAQENVKNMIQALRLASQCEPTKAAFSVGCVITDCTTGQVLATGYSREEPGNTHAEEVALNKLMAASKKAKGGRAETQELNLYTTMEPCGERLSKKASCAERILAFNEGRFANQDGQVMRVAAVWQGVGEPEDFIADAAGTRLLRQRGSGLTVSAVDPGTHFRNPRRTSQQTLTLESGWLEREAIRLAKQGHEDLPAPQSQDEVAVWQEEGWLPDESPLPFEDRNASHTSKPSISFPGRDIDGTANVLR